jgi:hypothetical protein
VEETLLRQSCASGLLAAMMKNGLKPRMSSKKMIMALANKGNSALPLQQLPNYQHLENLSGLWFVCLLG